MEIIERLHEDLNRLLSEKLQINDFIGLIDHLIKDNQQLKERVYALENNINEPQQIKKVAAHTIDRTSLAEITGFSKSRIIQFEKEGILESIKTDSNSTNYLLLKSLNNLLDYKNLKSVNRDKILNYKTEHSF